MTIKPHEFVIASCSGKDPLTNALARQIARRMRAKGRNVQAYKCQCCGHWHVGRSSEK